MSALNRRLATHDGALLAHDAHLPDEATWPVPVVVTRTAYGRGVHLAEGRAWRRAGFAFVAQDVRGRHDSDGVWRPYRGERADGAALLDHVLAQPWCDGRVVAHGGSYSGYTAWAMAVERPAAVRAVISLGASLGLHRTKFTPGGILRLTEHVGWWLERADGRTSRPGLRETVFAEDPDLLAHLPVTAIADRTGVDLPHFTDALEEFAEFGVDGSPPESLTGAELRALDCAVLHAGGWYDLLAPEVVGLWRTVGSGVHPRPPRRLVLGPWEHDLGMAGRTRTGAMEHGPGSSLAWGREFLAFVGAALDGSLPSGARVFRTGARTWTSTPDWPPAGVPTAWFPAADGALEPRPPASAGAVEFAHDPHDPFPSVLPGADRAGTLDREDVARFTSAELTGPLTVEGVPEVDLVVTSSAVRTDWIVRLLQLDPDGVLTDLAVATTTTPGGTQRRTVEFSPLAVEVGTGSRLVLEVTSSDFPHLARNPGTGQDRCRATVLASAVQRVLCGAGATTLRMPGGTS